MTVMKTLVALVAIVLLSGCATTREGGPPSEPAALDSVLAAWGPAWSSSDAGKLVPLYTEDVYFEDVPLGAVVKNRDALGGFAAGVFAGFADLRFEVTSRFVSADGKWGSMEWVFPRSPGHQSAISCARRVGGRVPRRQDQPGG